MPTPCGWPPGPRTTRCSAIPTTRAAEGADVSALLSATRRLLSQQAGADSELDALTDRLTDLVALAADLGADFGAYTDGLDADPARLEQIEARRAVLAALVRKYADGPDPDLAAVQDWAKRAAERLADIDVSDEAIAALAARRDAATAALTALRRRDHHAAQPRPLSASVPPPRPNWQGWPCPGRS